MPRIPVITLHNTMFYRSFNRDGDTSMYIIVGKNGNFNLYSYGGIEVFLSEITCA